MRIKSILLAVMIALGFAACNNEDVPQIEGADGTVSVKVVASSKSTVRAMGDLTSPGVDPAGLAAESGINRTQVWVFFGDLLDGYGDATTDEVTGIPVHVGSREIYIVVNGDALGLTKFTPKATIEAAVTSVPVDIATNGLVMTAEKITHTIVAGQNLIGYTSTDPDITVLDPNPVKVRRVNARVAVVSADLSLTDSDQTDIFDELRDLEIAMFNVNTSAKIFENNDASGQWIYGADWPSSANSYTKDTELAHFHENITAVDPISLIQIDNAPYFYVNPLETVNKMFIVLRGKAYKNGSAVVAEGLYTDAAGFTYYPVWVNGAGLGYDFGTSDDGGTGIVVRNTQYNISLTIKKIGNPTIDPVEEGFLDVKVEVMPWAVVTQDVTW